MDVRYLIGLVIAKILFLLIICFLFGSIRALFRVNDDATPFLHNVFSLPTVASALCVALVVCLAEFSASASASRDAELIRFEPVCAGAMLGQANNEEARVCSTMMGGDNAERSAQPLGECAQTRSQRERKGRCA